MSCRDCKNFKPSPNVEASKELAFDKKCFDGKCDITNSKCKSDSECNCNSFDGNCDCK